MAIRTSNILTREFHGRIVVRVTKQSPSGWYKCKLLRKAGDPITLNPDE